MGGVFGPPILVLTRQRSHWLGLGGINLQYPCKSGQNCLPVVLGRIKLSSVFCLTKGAFSGPSL